MEITDKKDHISSSLSLYCFSSQQVHSWTSAGDFAASSVQMKKLLQDFLYKDASVEPVAM